MSPQRLALLGDVHANLAALDAVLGAIDAAGIDRGVLTGDLVMRGPEPVETVERIRERRWPAVAGNTDIKVAGNVTLGLEPEPPRPPKHRASSRVGSRSWTMRRLPAADARFLADLPLVVRVPLGGHDVVVVHATPSDPSARIDPDADTKQLVALAKALNRPACVVTGHTHRPHAFRRKGTLFVNPGAVGEGRDGDRQPRWAWLEATEEGLVAHLEELDLDLANEREEGDES